MNAMWSGTIEASGKKLTVVAVNLNSADDFNEIEKITKPIFSELAPFVKREKQVLYVRDIKKYAIDSIYPGGHTYIDSEVQIAVPAWPADETHLTDCIAHELHHLARWQTVGYGKTLGEAIASEGVATFYAESKSHWQAPWSRVAVSDECIQMALKEWDNPTYSHKDWFFGGTLGKWVGYSLGYQLSKKVFSEGFNVDLSLHIPADALKKLLVNR